MAKRKKIEVKIEADAPVRGGIAAFLFGGAGLLAIVFFFLPWYGDLRGTVSGWTLLVDPSALAGGVDLPKTIATARQHIHEDYTDVGGRWFGVLWLLLATASAATGLFERSVRGLVGTRLRDAVMPLTVGLLAVGLVQFLNLLNMNVLPNARFAGILAGLLLMAAALAGLGWLRALDAEVGDVEGDLPARDWGIWLGGLLVASVIHYLGVCYVLIKQGPKFIASGRFLTR